MEPDYEQNLKKHPFLTYLTYGGIEYIGVVQNIDAVVTTIYDFGMLRSVEEKNLYLKLANAWWWESNRNIPINLFLRHEWTPFRYTLRVLNNKDVNILYGPRVSLNDMVQKRTKRRAITLVRRVP